MHAPASDESISQGSRRAWGSGPADENIPRTWPAESSRMRKFDLERNASCQITLSRDSFVALELGNGAACQLEGVLAAVARLVPDRALSRQFGAGKNQIPSNQYNYRQSHQAPESGRRDRRTGGVR